METSPKAYPLGALTARSTAISNCQNQERMPKKGEHKYRK